jgi:CheY-like chemotaxis protein
MLTMACGDVCPTSPCSLRPAIRRTPSFTGGRLDPGVELLAKPYTREALAQKIRHVLANHAQRRVAARRSPPHPANENALKGATVLLVEDDGLIRLTTMEMLSDIGCKVTEANTAEEALKILNEDAVDILLTDIGLPGVSGLQLAKEARARRPHLCLVLATGDAGLRSEAALLGAVLVVKPYTPDVLCRGLENALKIGRQN